MPKRRGRSPSTTDSAPPMTRLQKFLAKAKGPPRGPDGEPLIWDGDQWRPQYTDAERAERIAANDAAFALLERWYAAGRPEGGPAALAERERQTNGGPDDNAA